jgi:cytidyltransferase-like protein
MSSTASSSTSLSDNDTSEDDEPAATSPSSHAVVDLKNTLAKLGNNEWLKNEYRRVGASKHFQKYIYAWKSLTTFDRELELLLSFVDLNKTAFSKILKKYDKKTGSSIREGKLAGLLEKMPFLEGNVLRELREETTALIKEVNGLKPSLPKGWEKRKVYTIGCFDLFHRGHQNVLLALRAFGHYIVAGIHDDESYFKLKNKVRRKVISDLSYFLKPCLFSTFLSLPRIKSVHN